MRAASPAAFLHRGHRGTENTEKKARKQRQAHVFATGEVLFTPRLAETRAAPAHDLLVRLLAVDDAGGRRELGHYTMHHRPWAG
jgi:hypothetical protein